MCRRPFFAVFALLALFAARSASAQEIARYSLESVVAVDEFGGQNSVHSPQIIIDISAAVRVGDHWQVYVRPWFRLPRPNAPGLDVPDWDKELYQAGVRYERSGPVAVRFDAGQILSPIGLGLFDVRPGLNPTIAPHITSSRSIATSFMPAIAIARTAPSIVHPLTTRAARSACMVTPICSIRRIADS